jgi:putative ABC transport system permease protein
MAWRPSAASLYRALLLGYPAEFRHEYGAEMERVFAERLAAEPRARVWLDALLDTALSAPREQFHILRADIRYGLRLLVKSPGFAAIAVLTLALGIGGATAIFSLLNAVLIRSLPYGNPERLVYIWTPIPRLAGVPREIGPGWPDYFAWARMSHSFSSIAGFHSGYVNLAGKSGTEHLGATEVTSSLFPTLQVAPQLGRGFVEEDERQGAAHVAVISDAFWRSRFGGDPAALGRTLELDRESYRIVGIMPPGFGYPHATDMRYPDTPEKRTDIWAPLVLSESEKTERGVHSGGNAIARLKPGIDLRRAQAEMSAIAAQLDLRRPELARGFTAYVQPMLDSLLGPTRRLMLLLMGAVLMVLAICCANIANLLLARAAGRTHEIGVRTAMGAGRSRIVRQMVTEALLLAAAGGTGGVAAGWAAMRLLVRLAPATIPRLDEVSLDPRVLAFAVAASLITGHLFGLLPAFTASRLNVTGILAQGGTRGATAASKRVRGAMIVAEIAVAVTLLAGAGLMVRSFQKLSATDLGFSRSSLTMKVTLDDRYSKPEEQVRLYAALRDRVRSVPGIAAAGEGSALPLGHRESISFIEIEGRTLPKNSVADFRGVSGGFCEALGTRLIAGRYLTDADTGRQPRPVLINRRFRDVYFPHEDPLGRNVRFGGGPETPWATIAGVVEDVHHSSLEAAPRPTFYSPLGGEPRDAIFLAIAGRVPPDRLAAEVREAIRQLDPSVAVSDIQTMETAIGESGAHRRFQTALLAAFAMLAVFLAAVGIYGLMAYSIRQRTAEIGIRMAMGASRGRVVWMVLREGMAMATAGAALGMGGAFAATRLIASWLYGVSPTDAVTFAAVPLVLLAAAAAACIVPALRAARVDPVRAMAAR